MDKIKRIIIIASIILLLLVIIIVVLLNMQDKENIQKESNQIPEEEVIATWTQVNDYEIYYTVKNVISNYIVYIQELNGDQYIDTGKLEMTEDEIKVELQKEALAGIKSILDKQYIETMMVNDTKIISEQEIYKQNGNYKENVNYNLTIEKMLTKNLNENIVLALVNAKIVNKDLNIIVKLDKANRTYSVFLEDYIQKYNYNENMKEEEININQDGIEENGYNIYVKVEATEAYIISQYFSEYKIKMLDETQEAYKLLDTEYSQRKYGEYQNFKNYVDENKEKIQQASIDKYQINEHDGTKEYVCIDNNGKYYIFFEDSLTNYRVLLDTYTVDVPEFLEKYNKNSNEIKVGLNIQKIFEAINDGDYNYAYNKLDETFRRENFSNQETFEKYIKENFYAKNTLQHNSCEKIGDVYMYSITIKDATENNGNSIKKTFVMQLKEGTDFVMSFSME